MDGEMVHDHHSSPRLCKCNLKIFLSYKIFSWQILIETDNHDKERQFIWQLLSNNLVSHSTF